MVACSYGKILRVPYISILRRESGSVSDRRRSHIFHLLMDNPENTIKNIEYFKGE